MDEEAGVVVLVGVLEDIAGLAVRALTGRDSFLIPLYGDGLLLAPGLLGGIRGGYLGGNLMFAPESCGRWREGPLYTDAGEQKRHMS